MFQCQGPFDIQFFDLLRAPQPCSWTVFRLRLWCNAAMRRRFTLIHLNIASKWKWCANLYQLFPREYIWVCTDTDWHYTWLPIWSILKLWKRIGIEGANQVSLRSGGISGASFVVLYAALACAACLLAVPRSQFRHVAKQDMNHSSREFFHRMHPSVHETLPGDPDLCDPGHFPWQCSLVPCPRNTFWSNDMFHIIKVNSIG